MDDYLNAWQKALDFSGRARRREYAWFTLTTEVIGLYLVLMETWWPMVPFLAIYVLIVAVPFLAVSVRRFHDLGLSGWWLLPVILLRFWLPLLGWVASLFLLFKDGQRRDNRYGPDTKTPLTEWEWVRYAAVTDPAVQSVTDGTD